MRGETAVGPVGQQNGFEKIQGRILIGFLVRTDVASFYSFFSDVQVYGKMRTT